MLLGIKEKVEIKDIDIRNYSKFILRKETDIEGRELLGCIKSNIYLKHKILNLVYF